MLRQWPINGDDSIENEEVEVIDYYALWRKVLSTQKQALALVNSGDSSLYLDLNDVPNILFEQVYDKVSESIDTISKILEDTRLCTTHPHIRFKNFPRFTELRELRSDRIGKFCAIKGIVRSITKVQPWIITAVFECKCGARVRTKQDTFRLSFPEPCKICKKGSWELIPEKSKTMDYQLLTIQESPEGMRGGEIPAEVEVRLTNDLCNLVNPGNRVNVFGVLKTIPVRKNSLQLRNIFDGNNIELIQRDYEEILINDTDLEEIKAFSKDPQVFNNLKTSIAPSIYGHDVLKEAILLQLFGGVRHVNKDGTFNRGDIHILIVGDPGVAKSKMLGSVLELCPRGIRVSGGGSTKAGLTATAIQNTDGQWALEAGAIVLADKGMLIIDEIDKMRNEDRASLHEGMEDQIISIAKAGISCTLQARCSILAAANPKLGRFDDFVELASQIDMPPTLLSRFDLIFTMSDKPSKETDEELAQFLLTKYDNQVQIVDNEFIRKYVSYAKLNIFPKMTLNAQSLLKSYYVNVRNLSSKRVKSVPITARQLEALIRLSEASARIRLSEIIDIQDAERAIEVLDRCLKYLAYDPITGQMDIDRMTGKMSGVNRDAAKNIVEVYNQIKDGQTLYANKKVLFEKMVERGFSIERTEPVLEKLIQGGEFMWVGYKQDTVKKI